MLHFRCVINIKNDEVIKAFGKKLRDFRISKGLSQEQLANEANVPLSQVGRIERGEVNPTLSTVNAFARALNIGIKDFFI